MPPNPSPQQEFLLVLMDGAVAGIPARVTYPTRRACQRLQWALKYARREHPQGPEIHSAIRPDARGAWTLTIWHEPLVRPHVEPAL